MSRVVPITPWGSAGLAPMGPLCPLWQPDGTGSSCISGSGSSICGGFTGAWQGDSGQVYAECDYPPDVSAEQLQLLNDLAARYSDAPDVIGFLVLGPVAPYEDEWHCESRAPLRWRSGEWMLVPADRFAVLRRG